MARITVEDCLEKERNRFALVVLVSKRSKQLLTGGRSTIENRQENKSIVLALREVAEGTVCFGEAILPIPASDTDTSVVHFDSGDSSNGSSNGDSDSDAAKSA
jgi:DNA-directed RNA polymerase subunit omega